MIKKLVAGALTAAGITGAAVFGAGQFEGDVHEYQCPDASYVRTLGEEPDSRAKFTVCENGHYTITAREFEPGKYTEVIYDELNHVFVDAIPAE